MAETDFVSALSQLLVNPALRESFFNHPETVADRLNISDSERAMFISLPPEQIKHQAQLLITKRMRETFTQIPLTVKWLGESAAAAFREYAIQYWPDTHRRHSIDVFHFLLYLRERQLPFNKSEYNRIRFKCARKRLQICFVKDAMLNGRLHAVLQVIYRMKNDLCEWRIYFKA